jgi:hypothetical protein
MSMIRRKFNAQKSFLEKYWVCFDFWTAIEHNAHIRHPNIWKKKIVFATFCSSSFKIHEKIPSLTCGTYTSVARDWIIFPADWRNIKQVTPHFPLCGALAASALCAARGIFSLSHKFINTRGQGESALCLYYTRVLCMCVSFRWHIGTRVCYDSAWRHSTFLCRFAWRLIITRSGAARRLWAAHSQSSASR